MNKHPEDFNYLQRQSQVLIETPESVPSLKTDNTNKMASLQLDDMRF